MFPLRLASPAAFAVVRDFLSAAGYCEPALLERLNVPRLHDLLFPYGLRREALHALYQGDDRASFLARLLMGGYTVTRAEADRWLPLGAFEELGLVEHVDAGRLRAPALLYPAPCV